MIYARHGLFQNMNINKCLADGYLKYTAYMYFSFLVIIGIPYFFGCYYRLCSSMCSTNTINGYNILDYLKKKFICYINVDNLLSMYWPYVWPSWPLLNISFIKFSLQV